MGRNSANLDFLRATAVIYVVVFHILLEHQHFTLLRLNLDNLGYWGVLMFFVHTSLVLMLSLERQPELWGHARQYAAFMIRRCFRLLPLSMAAVLLIYTLRLPLDFHDHAFHRAVFSAPLLISNLLLAQNITGYHSIEAPLWSLPYEMQMYLCLPLLFWIARRRSSGLPIATLFVLAAAAATLVGMAVGIRRDLPFVPWDLAHYVPCFLSGVIVYQLSRRFAPRLPGSLWPLFVLAITITYLLASHLRWPWLWRWVSLDWIACLILGFGIAAFRSLPAGRLSRASAQIARYSYGIYLTHFGCIWLAFVALAGAPAAARWTVFLVLAVGLPIAFYHLLEAPFIRLGARVTALAFEYPAPSVTTSRARAGSSMS